MASRPDHVPADGPADRGGRHAGGRAPLYRQLADRLRTDIEQGRFEAGEQLPSEPAIADEAGVSRSVVRQALSELATDGLVRKGRGRRATVAAQPRYERYVSRSSGFYEQFRRRGITLETRVVRAEVTALPSEPAAFLDADEAIVLDRVRSVGGVPLAYVRTYLPLERCRPLLDEDLADRSLHEALATRLGLRVASGRRTVHAVLAPADVADDLEVAPHDPLLLLRSEGRDQHGRPLEWFQTWHPADRIAFEIQVLSDDEQMVERFDPTAPTLTDAAAHLAAVAAERPTIDGDVPAPDVVDQPPSAEEAPAVLVVAADAASIDRLVAAHVASGARTVAVAADLDAAIAAAAEAAHVPPAGPTTTS